MFKKDISDKVYYGTLISMGIIAIVSAIFIVINSKEESKQMHDKCNKMHCENSKPQILNGECVCITLAK